MGGPLRVKIEEGSLLRIVLDRPKGNVLDSNMVEALRGAVSGAAEEESVAAIIFEGEGAHFSFGASVEEHRREHVRSMLGRFHALFRELAACRKVLLAAVRGQCLGGGLELAAFCHRVFAAPDAKLGCPEVRLGVFAPVGSIVLPLRVGPGRAADLLLTGRTMDAREALAAGLVDEVADDPAAAARAWHAKHLAGLSSVALGHAARALRRDFDRALLDSLEALERQYLEELVPTHDAEEGITAFLEKRQPAWTHR